MILRKRMPFILTFWGSHFLLLLLGLSLTGLIVLLFAMVTIFAVKKKCATFKGVRISLLAILLTVISSIIATVLIWMGVNALWAEKMTLFSGAVYDSLYYQWAFLLITASICFLIWRKLRTVNEWEMTLSAIFLGVIFLILLTQFLPGASYLFVGHCLYHY